MIVESLARVRRANASRGDEHLAHVADLYGCDRATWYRRNGYPAPPHDDAKLRKFDLGNSVEANVVGLLEADGRNVDRHTKIGLALFTNGDLRGFELDPDDVVDDVVVGHPDAIVDDDVLLEIKTTDSRRVADEVSPHYALQAVAYALGLNLPEARVHVTHVANFAKDEIEYVLDPESYRDRVTERVHQVLVHTAKGRPLPEPQPAAESAAWACKYCSYIEQCTMDGGPMPGAKL